MRIARYCRVLALLLVAACGPAPAGPAGEKGDPGEPGGRVSGGIFCYKNANGFAFGYHVTDFTSGDAHANCEVAGTTFTVSNSRFWKAGLVGASEGLCFLYFDLDTASAGRWTFSSKTSGNTAVYTDTGSANDGMVVTFAASDCGSF
jgi:hypothetical protein